MNYLIHNGSRGRHNRVVRAAQPAHGGHKQYVCKSALRLVRGRPLQVSEATLQEHLDEIREKESQGLLYVTTPQGFLVDLVTLTTVPLAPESPKPNPPLDSAANDPVGGAATALFVGEPPPPETFEMPVPPSVFALENPVSSEEEPAFKKRRK